MHHLEGGRAGWGNTWPGEKVITQGLHKKAASKTMTDATLSKTRGRKTTVQGVHGIPRVEGAQDHTDVQDVQSNSASGVQVPVSLHQGWKGRDRRTLPHIFSQQVCHIKGS